MIKNHLLESVWSAKLDSALEKPYKHMQSQRVFCAFNAITDAVVHYDKDTFSSLIKKTDKSMLAKTHKLLPLSEIETKEDFFSTFIDMFSKGKALELPCLNEKLFSFFRLSFKEKLRMGGQAGIISNQMASLGVNTVCYCPILSKPQSKLFLKKNLYFPTFQNDRLTFKKPQTSYNQADPTKVNWIFEFKKGDRLKYGKKTIVCPRSNRIIVASRPKGYMPIFSVSLDHHLPLLSNSFDVFFLAGYQSFQKQMDGRHFLHFLNKMLWQLTQLRVNKHGRFHLEYVAIHDPIMDKAIYPALLPHFDSLGINEMETIHFLKRIGDYPLAQKLEHDESPYNYYQACLRLFHKFKLKRLHAHTLGYFILLLRKDYAGKILPQEFVNSLLFASRVADCRAYFGSAPNYSDLKKLSHLKISTDGIHALKSLANRLYSDKASAKRFMLNGIHEADDHILIAIPTAIVKPKATVGLGDTISSIAFASEPF